MDGRRGIAALYSLFAFLERLVESSRAGASSRSRCRGQLALAGVCVVAVTWLSGCASTPAQIASPSPQAPTASITPPPAASTPTTQALPTLTAGPKATPLPTNSTALTRTPAPTPTPDPRRRVVAFVSDWTSNDEVYLLDVEAGEAVNLTHSPGEDRDPDLSPDGRFVSYRSNAGGGWAFYRIDLATGERMAIAGGAAAATAYKGRLVWDRDGGDRHAYESYRDGNLNIYIRDREGAHRELTRDPAGDYGPAWRPGTSQVAFASWRDEQKDLYAVDADDGSLLRLTDSPADEESPAWHPDGQRLAFVCWEDNDADLCELDLERGAIARLTTDPYPDRSPTYAPDGTLFWTRYAPGAPFEVHDPHYPGRWQLWMRAPDGRERPVSMPVPGMDAYTPVAGYALWPSRGFPPVAAPTPSSTPAQEEPVGLVTLDIECAGNGPRIHADLAETYEALRAEVLAQTGYDLLGTVSDMHRGLGYSRRDYGHLSWHRAGRAVDLLFEWRDPEDGPNLLQVSREDLGPQTYWRLYLHTRQQDGTVGEPLTVAPWRFWFNLDAAREPGAYADGGRADEIPSGYYVDVTRLAKRRGWHRIAAYEEADFDWRTDSLGREFWHYQRTDGLTWWQAMGQVYPLETLERLYGWTVCVDELGMDPSWLIGKGIPAATPMPG